MANQADWQAKTQWYRDHRYKKRLFHEIKRIRAKGYQIGLAEDTLVVRDKQGEIPTTTMTIGSLYPYVAPVVTPGRALEVWWTPGTSLLEIMEHERGANSARAP